MLRYPNSVVVPDGSVCVGDPAPVVQHEQPGLVGHQHNVIDGMLLACVASAIFWVIAIALIV